MIEKLTNHTPKVSFKRNGRTNLEKTSSFSPSIKKGSGDVSIKQSPNKNNSPAKSFTEST